MKLGLFVLIFIVLSTSLSARKVTVSLSSMEQRAEIIVVAESLESVAVYEEADVDFHLVEVLKGELREGNIVVTVPSLSFEKGINYILFLNHKEGSLYWIKGNSLRLKATVPNIANIKKEL